MKLHNHHSMQCCSCVWEREEVNPIQIEQTWYIPDIPRRRETIYSGKTTPYATESFLRDGVVLPCIDPETSSRRDIMDNRALYYPFPHAVSNDSVKRIGSFLEKETGARGHGYRIYIPCTGSCTRK